MSDAFTVESAHKRFGETQALVGADVVLRRGEWLGLLGPNGAGKTTLVRAMSGRVRLDRGAIALLDTPLAGTSADEKVRRKLGTIPQEIALYPLLTATENLRAFGSFHGLSGRELGDRVTWSLSWTGLAERSSEPIRNFSGGMKRRLNIACSVLHRPEVILLDEPTVGVDPQSRHRIWEMLAELRADGASLLLTTHQLDEAQDVCDRIVIIDHGKTIAVGTLSELLRDTIGTVRRVTFTLDGQAPESLGKRGFACDDGHHVQKELSDIAAELPPMLEEVKTAGAIVTDVHIKTPTLQDVFLHLTGRELRE
jgi:linearmycin/streptolysin S transport system ATP-binding protein